MSENGNVRQVQLAPINVQLDGCQFAIGERPDGLKVLQFLHQSGALVFTATLSKEAAAELARQLTGITIARDLPKMAIPKTKGHH